MGSADVYVEGGTGPRPSPAKPTNLSTDLSGTQAILHAQFEIGSSLNDQGQVVYTLVDGSTGDPICTAYGPVVGDGMDSPYVVQEALQTGVTYGWVAQSYDGKYYSLPTDPQTFTFRAPPSIALSATNGPPGTNLVVSGRSFAADEQVVITFSDPATTLATTTSNAFGALSASVTIPAAAPPETQQTITATGATNDTASTQFTSVLTQKFL